MTEDMSEKSVKRYGRKIVFIKFFFSIYVIAVILVIFLSVCLDIFNIFLTV